MSSTSLTRRALLASSVLAIPATALAAASEPALYKDAAAPIPARVADLLRRMTLEEKVGQLRAIWIGKAGYLDAEGGFSPERAAKSLANGVGQIFRPADTMGTRAFLTRRNRPLKETAPMVNAIQKFLTQNTRLGVPALFTEETAHGYAVQGATIFPTPPALASTWDCDLVEQVFTVTARQARLSGVTVGLSPVLDLMREPRFGRAEEFFSEDPYLTGQMGTAAVWGLQGRQRPLAKDRVFATLKHFVHGSPVGGLNIAPYDVSERTLRENDLAPFAQVIKAAAPAFIMPSYNEVAGVPAHADRALLQDTGRGRLGFRGAYISDYSAISNLKDQHHIVADNGEAAIVALKAGVDAELGDSTAFTQLPDLVRAGRVSEALVDAATARILALKFEAGLFENPFVDAERAPRETDTQADRRLARLAAQKAIVLLKNDGILPLDPAKALNLAVIGPNAVEPMLGGYSGENDKAIGVLAGLQAAAGRDIRIEHADGVWITSPDNLGRHLPRADIRRPSPAENAARIAQAVEVAGRADLVLLVLGDNAQVTREAVTTNLPGDRSTLGLFGDQDALFDAMIATGKPVVVVLLNGRPLAVTRIAEKASAVLEGWYLGQEGGPAVADALFGKINPGGKLTVSFPRAVGELPVYYNQHPTTGLNAYIEGRRQPLFPFGHGLSYTRFEISAPRLGAARIKAGEAAIVEVDVANIGSRTGDEVVQLYVRDDVSSVPRPLLELKGFQRASLKPGERRTLRFVLPSDALAFWDIDMNWGVEPGTFTIGVGPSSAQLKSATLTVI